MLTLQQTFDYCQKLKSLVAPPTAPASIVAGPPRWRIPPEQLYAVRLVYGADNASQIGDAYEALGQICEEWFGVDSPICRQVQQLIRSEYALFVSRLLDPERPYRDHVLHAVSVRVVMTHLMKLFPGLKASLYAKCRAMAADRGLTDHLTDTDVEDAITRAALLHDLGYCFHHARLTASDVQRWYNPALRHLPALALHTRAASRSCRRCERFVFGLRPFGKWFHIPAATDQDNHGLPTALQLCRHLCLQPPANPREHAVWWLACRAICAHDADREVVYCDDPLGFLLRLGDALQSYGRPHYELRPDYESGPRTACESLTLSAAAADVLKVDLVFNDDVYDGPRSRKEADYTAKELESLRRTSTEPLTPKVTGPATFTALDSTGKLTRWQRCRIDEIRLPS